MNKTNEIKPVQDYWNFTRELKAQLNAVKALGHGFFELDDLCEWSIKNDVTVLNKDGLRVSVIDDCLDSQQREVYKKLRKAVKDLDTMLANGEVCFIKKEEKKDE